MSATIICLMAESRHKSRARERTGHTSRHCAVKAECSSTCKRNSKGLAMIVYMFAQE